MSDTAHLKLPYLAALQAKTHATVSSEAAMPVFSAEHGDARTLLRAERGSRAMTRPAITFGWQINLGHILVAVSTLTAGVAAYTDLRRDVTDQIRTNAVQAARLEALTERMNARDVADATLSARFGAVEELMRDMRNELRDMRGPPLPANDPRRSR